MYNKKIEPKHYCVCVARWSMVTTSESLLLPFRNLGNFVHSRCSSSLACVNEYLAVESGGYVNDTGGEV